AKLIGYRSTQHRHQRRHLFVRGDGWKLDIVHVDQHPERRPRPRYEGAPGAFFNGTPVSLSPTSAGFFSCRKTKPPVEAGLGRLPNHMLDRAKLAPRPTDPTCDL